MTREIFYPPEGEHFIAPQGVPIWDLSVLYLHRELFFGFQIIPCNRPFLTRDFFYWRMGWMDGWDGLVSTCFCSAYFSKTTKYMTLIISMPPRRRFTTSFVKKSKTMKKLFFVKKNRTKRVFFEHFFSKVSIVLKRIPIFGLKRISILLD